MTNLPRLALSVRQPWAWAIVHAGKDMENRSRGAMRYLDYRGRVAVHAPKGMTQAEYDEAAEFMRSIGVLCPVPAKLWRGGIIGTVDVTGAQSRSASPWFVGPCALALRNAASCPFVGAIGQLGFFEWRPSGDQPEQPARWMLPGHSSPATASRQIDLFG